MNGMNSLLIQIRYGRHYLAGLSRLHKWFGLVRASKEINLDCVLLLIWHDTECTATTCAWLKTIFLNCMTSSLRNIGLI